MGKLAFFLLASVALTVLLVNPVESSCCYCSLLHCKDRSTCIKCCGIKKCNLLCCGCECRQRPNDNLIENSDGFEEIDMDGDGYVDRDEALTQLKSGACGNYSEKIDSFDETFKLLDTDGDGKLTYKEIDTLV